MGQATFRGPAEVYRADTCAPLIRAAQHGAVDLWARGRDTYPGHRLPCGTLPHLRSVGLWEASADQNWGLDWHRNEGIEFTCVTKGRTAFSCNDQDFDLPGGTITITRPWQLHRVGAPTVTASSLCWFILDVGVRRPNQHWRWPAWLPIPDDDLVRLSELLRNNERPVWPATRPLLHAVERLETALRGAEERALARIALCISEILIELADLLEQQDLHLDPYLSSTERMVELFLQQLPDSLDRAWTVREMAAECGVGKTRFIHYCKQVTNLSPVEYLTRLRLRRATELLVDSQATVTDVAFQCGFCSSQYFATVFRRHTGRTPTETRWHHAGIAAGPQPRD